MVVRSVAGVHTGPGAHSGCFSLSKRKTAEIWSGLLLHLVPKIEWRCAYTFAHVFLACTFYVTAENTSTVVGASTVDTHADQEVEEVECGTKMHRWSVAESLLGSDYPQVTVLRYRVKADTSHSGTKNVPRLLGIAKNVCSRRPATGPYLEPNEWWSPSPQIQWDVYHVVPSAAVFGTEILYVYLIAYLSKRKLKLHTCML